MPEDSVKDAIQAALERDPSINLHRHPIRIGTDDVVRLDGVVADIVAKRKAMRIAREVTGSARLVDALRIEVSREREDEELAQAVLRNLMQEPVFSGTDLGEGTAEADTGEQRIGVAAHDGIVRLTGSVISLSHRRLAEVLAWWTPGSADVDNRIRVSPPEEDNDDEIADAIRIVLEKEPAVDAEQIGIHVRDRVVTLTGQVRTEENRRIAVYDCWYIPGVHDVRDQLTAAQQGPVSTR